MAELTLTEYAFVRTGLSDGLELPDLLAYARVDLATWLEGARAWNERELDAIEAYDAAFIAELELACQSARKRWMRSVSPIDTDLRAWFDYLQGLADSHDAAAFLERTGGDVAILAHVHRLWSDRLASDEATRRAAEKLLAETPGEPPMLQAEPPRLLARLEPLRAPPGSVVETRELAEEKQSAESVLELPFEGGGAVDVEPDLATPPLLAPMPTLAEEASHEDDTTQAIRFKLPASETPLPFEVPPKAGEASFATIEFVRPLAVDPIGVLGASDAAAQTATATESLLTKSLVSDEATSPLPEQSESEQPPILATEELAPFAAQGTSALPFLSAQECRLPLEAHAAMHAELNQAKALATDVLALYGFTEEEKRAEDAAWGKRLEADPAQRQRWFQAYLMASERLKKGRGDG